MERKLLMHLDDGNLTRKDFDKSLNDKLTQNRIQFITTFYQRNREKLLLSEVTSFSQHQINFNISRQFDFEWTFQTIGREFDKEFMWVLRGLAWAKISSLSIISTWIKPKAGKFDAFNRKLRCNEGPDWFTICLMNAYEKVFPIFSRTKAKRSLFFQWVVSSHRRFSRL